MNVPEVEVSEQAGGTSWYVRIEDGDTTLIVEPLTPEELTYSIDKIRGNRATSSIVSLE